MNHSDEGLHSAARMFKSVGTCCLEFGSSSDKVPIDTVFSKNNASFGGDKSTGFVEDDESCIVPLCPIQTNRSYRYNSCFVSSSTSFKGNQISVLDLPHQKNVKFDVVTQEK